MNSSEGIKISLTNLILKLVIERNLGRIEVYNANLSA